MAENDSVLPDLAEVDRIVEKLGRGPEAVIGILQAIQDKYRYLPESALRRVCEITEITPASLASVATFYAQFRHKPAGRHTIRVCVGTACHVQGSQHVVNAFQKHLRISENEDTDEEGLFTIEKVACLGCCMLAPVVQMSGFTYGLVEPHRVSDIVSEFLQARPVEEELTPVPGEDKAEVRICLCSSCVASGAAKVYQELLREVRLWKLAANVKIVGCTGLSYLAPLVEIAMPDGPKFRYGRITPSNVRAVLFQHLRPRGIFRRFSARMRISLEALWMGKDYEPAARFFLDEQSGEQCAYLKRQVCLSTEHGGEIAPLDIEDYIRHGGFKALRNCLFEVSPQEIVRRVLDSGLRGRGGAGFPTGKKWALVQEAQGEKYIICNGDEGDPGAFMDRIILESFPFRVIEGMAIAAYSIGSNRGFFYVRAEYPLATRRVREAIKICQQRGFLGDGILRSNFSLHLTLVEGAGAFVCGEETALIAAIEGRSGMPHYRPPFPSQSGLWGRPTVVNNVETLALVPWIMRHGAERFSAMGTEGSKGTKTFALAGKIARSGLIEVPMGVTLREIVEDIGGGLCGSGRFKAVQVGGPSGGCVPARLADTPVDYEELTAAGTMMGSGGLVVLDDTDCMVAIARYFLAFTQMESCGKCPCCRIGTRRMLELLDRLCEGRGKKEDLKELETLAKAVQQGSLCGLGKTAPNPVLSTLKYFKNEYEAHLQGRCPAKKCSKLIRYVINDRCIGCTRCAQRCPVAAIAFTAYQKHEIDADKCSRCGACMKACPYGAVEVH